MDQKIKSLIIYVWKRKRLWKAIENNIFLIRNCLKCLLNGPLRKESISRKIPHNSLIYFVKQARYCICHKKNVDPSNITPPCQNIYHSNILITCFKFKKKNTFHFYTASYSVLLLIIYKVISEEVSRIKRPKLWSIITQKYF